MDVEEVVANDPKGFWDAGIKNPEAGKEDMALEENGLGPGIDVVGLDVSSLEVDAILVFSPSEEASANRTCLLT